MKNFTGYLVNKSELIECPKGHESKALELLNTTSNKQALKFHRSALTILFRLGYIRVSTDANGYTVEYWKSAKLSQFQKSIIENAKNNTTGKIMLYAHEWH